MKICMDCGGEIKRWNSWTSGSVCQKCRVKRGHETRRKKIQIHGKGYGCKDAKDRL